MNEENHWPTPPSWYGLTMRQRDFGNALTRMAGLYSSPVILGDGAETIIHSGSGFLLTIADRTFLVTNSHVVDSFRKIRKAGGGVSFTFGGKTFEPEIVDEAVAERIDLVTIDVTGDEFEYVVPGYWNDSGPTLQKYAPPSWPLDEPKVGEATVTVGWPGKHRKSEGGGKTEFAAFPMLGQFVGAVSDTSVVIPFDRDFWVSTDYDPANQVIWETHFEGISGSPVFALHRPHILPLELIGVVRSVGTTLDEHDKTIFEALYCTRADLIRPDGSIAIGGASS